MNKSRKTNTRSDDARLLARFVVENDDEAFGQLVAKYESLVWNICCRLLNNRCDAEDAFQATFLLLATRAHRIRKPKSLSSWLYGVAFRTASSIRKQRHRDLLPYECSEDERLDRDILEQVARKNENELVSAELMLLKERYRTPLLMFYFLGNSSSQIAQSLGLTVSAVESRLRQAKKIMKQRLRLKGIELTVSCSALAVPVIVISPHLTTTTISGIMSASITRGLSHWISNVSTTLHQTGAKLMLMKTFISFGLIGILSIGMVSHGVNGAQSGTTVVGVQGPATQLPITFVSDDDDDSATEVGTLEKLHRHVYDVWSQFSSRIFDSGNTEIQQGVLLNIEAFENAENLSDVTVVQGVLLDTSMEVRDPNVGATFTYRLTNEQGDSIPMDAGQGTFVLDVASEEAQRGPATILSNIPIVGRLFETERPQGVLDRITLQTDADSDDDVHDRIMWQTDTDGDDVVVIGVEIEVPIDEGADEDQ